MEKGRQKQLKRQSTKRADIITRRQFFKSSAAAACALMSAPTILPARVFGAEAPSNRVTVGMIGMGRQAYY
ncbi:MAG: twin-arginine translocation signal domain-containing protein, partial [Planctomycetota bacterium]